MVNSLNDSKHIFNENHVVDDEITIDDEDLNEDPFLTYIPSEDLKKRYLGLTELQKAVIEFTLGLRAEKNVIELCEKLGRSPSSFYFTKHKSKAVQDIMYDIANVDISDWASIMSAVKGKAMKGDVAAASFIAKYCKFAQEGGGVSGSVNKDTDEYAAVQELLRE